MGKLTIANLKKTLYYLRRNGLQNTWNAARERLSTTEPYSFRPLSEEEKKALREQARECIRNWSEAGKEVPSFSILVPAYRTNPAFLKDLVVSVQEQAYPLWELLLLDASGDESVYAALVEICKETHLPMFSERLVGDEDDAVNVGSIRYVRLAKNDGISENTNAGIPYANGRYVGLLDHDDVLTPDALLEMAKAIRGEKETLEAPLLVYSDEDKWDGAGQYYERNRKEDFNFDLLLSNNYICHFLVMERELFCELRLRKEFDGAQDYDLVLRAVAEMMARGLSPEQAICHVPKVLYHWRCHGGSTAENPQSKLYAYEAGKRALQDFADGQGWNAKAVDLKHVGFYRLNYVGDESSVLGNRHDLGAVGGKLISQRVLVGGRMARDGSIYYEGLKEGFSGYLHRGVLTQDAEAVDLRCICVAKEFWPLFEKVVGVPYVTRRLFIQDEKKNQKSFEVEIFDAETLPKDAEVKKLSLLFCKALREQGKRIMWDPEFMVQS
ncbi:MAG: glycosyltransferase [Lachnospiraceae bacterium]|nr:glycosyltransferase [Lachnospiraceae bacterium]